MIDAEATPRQKNLSSAMGGIFFGLVVAAMGAFFVYALWGGFQRAKETRAWVETPCEIQQSELAEQRPTPNSPIAYRAWVQYRYEFGGVARLGQSIKRVDGPTSHRHKAEALVAEFPVGASVSCWVNPDDPAETVLKHSTLAPLYSIWFPGLFVVAGLGIALASLRRAMR